MSGSRQMVLGAVTRGTGSHVASWRHPATTHEMLRSATSLEHYAYIAQTAERAKLHFIFLADSPVVTYQSNPAMLARAAQDYYLEPTTLLGALSAVTKHIGLVSTMSTTYSDPYTVARTFASLDHLSRGRASWNIVTTGNPAVSQNFGHDEHMAKDTRYGRADEFVRIVKRLWDSYEDDAFLRDPASGRFLDPAKMHPLHHRSDNFSIRGPLNIERTPQGYPVMFVAGSSDGARELAAETGDAMFTAQPDDAEGRAFYADVKGRLAKYGRTPNQLSILLGAMIITGETDAEAKAKHEHLRSLIDAEFAVHYMSHLAGIDLSGLPLDQPLPASLRAQPVWSRLALMMDVAERENMTFGEIAVHYADTYGHQLLVGSPKTIARKMQDLFETGVADGFLLRSPIYPGGIDDIANVLVPELQRQGLFRMDYEGDTFRDNLGLVRPRHPNAKQPAEVRPPAA